MSNIALDSGHGKTTLGKRSFDGSLMEYEFNHDVVGRIKKQLERHGVTVFLTSPDADIDVSLTERCNRACRQCRPVCFGARKRQRNRLELCTRMGNLRLQTNRKSTPTCTRHSY